MTCVDWFGPPTASKWVGCGAKVIGHPLRWGSDSGLAYEIACGSPGKGESQYHFLLSTPFLKEARKRTKILFYDSLTLDFLFEAPNGRTMDDFLDESQSIGWLSFSAEEVFRENVRLVTSGYGRGAIISVGGTHLGVASFINGVERYIVNILSVAGIPSDSHQGSAPGPRPGWCSSFISVYFGSACAQLTQRDLISVERRPPFSRSMDSVTAKVGYATGRSIPEGYSVCYYNAPLESYYEDYAYAQVVEVLLDIKNETSQFAAVFSEYFNIVAEISTNLKSSAFLRRKRNVVGVPGGFDGPYKNMLESISTSRLPLAQGDRDLTWFDDSVVYVYDSDEFPFFLGETYTQWHDNFSTTDEGISIGPVCGELGAHNPNLGECGKRPSLDSRVDLYNVQNSTLFYQGPYEYGENTPEMASSGSKLNQSKHSLNTNVFILFSFGALLLSLLLSRALIMRRRTRAICENDTSNVLSEIEIVN